MSLTAETIAKAESFDGIQAGIVYLNDVLKGPSYRALPDITRDSEEIPGDQAGVSLLVLGLMHPADDPRLDWWERGDSWGNRRLREISEHLKQWLREKHDVNAYPLPYHLEKGGIFLKDAAVLAGLGIIGQNNLLLHPKWGPRIRLRSIRIAADLSPTGSLTDFNPCDQCPRYCQKACPVNAFATGNYHRPACNRQMNADEANKVAEGEIDQRGNPGWVIKYCRDCELTCPVGM